MAKLSYIGAEMSGSVAGSSYFVLAEIRINFQIKEVLVAFQIAGNKGGYLARMTKGKCEVMVKKTK